MIFNYYISISNNLIAIYNNYICTFLSPFLKASKLCFALTSLGRPFHSLAALYLTDFNRKFEVGLGRVKQFGGNVLKDIIDKANR